MSVDAQGALAETVQDFDYWPDSGVHGSAFNKKNNILYAADTLGNAIWTQPIDKKSGRLGRPIYITKGLKDDDGPRHVIPHPSGNALYAVMEGSNQMVWYGISRHTQKPKLRGVYNLLPEDLLGGGNHWANEVVVSPSGAYIWATTRGRGEGTYGYIAVFSADMETGEIQYRNLLRPTTTSGGVANVVIPSGFDDRIIALTDNEIGFLEIWQLDEDAMWAEPVSRIVLSDQGNSRYKSGCCANAVWVD